MFANTLTITINAVANVLTRVNQDSYGSVYIKKTATDVMTLRFRNTSEKASVPLTKSPTTAYTVNPSVDRHNMFFEHRVFATASVPEKLYTMSAVIRLSDGSDPVYLGQLATGFSTLLAAQQAGLIAWES